MAIALWFDWNPSHQHKNEKNPFHDIAILNWAYFHSLWAKSHEQGTDLVAGSMYYLYPHQG